MDEKEAETNRSLINEKCKANRASETEEQRKEWLRIRHEKDRAKKRSLETRRPRETAPGHSQKIEAK